MNQGDQESLRFLLDVPAHRLEQAREALTSLGIELDPARNMVEPGNDATDDGIFTSAEIPAAVDAVNERLAAAGQLLRLHCNPRTARPADTKRMLRFLRDAVAWNAGHQPEALAVDQEALESLNREHPGLAAYSDRPDCR